MMNQNAPISWRPQKMMRRKEKFCLAISLL